MTALAEWAPPSSAQSYDNVGLQIGDPNRTITQGLIALDLTPDVLAEAQTLGAEVIITHHPLIFKPIKHLAATHFVNNLALRVAEAGIAHYAIHTNLDAAPDGVSFALAAQLGLQEVQLLDRFSDTLLKLVTFVPASHRQAVQEALGAAGAGRIGAYRDCAFGMAGTGYFRAEDTAQPFVGQADGALQDIAEIRLEMDVARWDLQRVLAALHTTHPYEEVAYDVYPVQQPHTRVGFGAIGTLPEPMALHDFLQHTTTCLHTTTLRYVGMPDLQIQRVAVCGGSGSSLIGAAQKAGADAFITADVTYHTYFNVLGLDGQPQMALINPGHYETEAMTEGLLQDWLGKRFPAVTWHRTQHCTNPVQSFIAKN